MEIILAIVVASAVIFFGALISMGNERQRKAIDGLHEQIVLWAMQDLKVKREHLVRNVQVSDPLGWLNKTASKACGHELRLQVSEIFETPNSLICISIDGNTKVIFSPLSPTNLRRIKNSKQNRLTQFTGRNPLLYLPKRTEMYEMSVLNSGQFFDLELGLVWEVLTGKSWGDNNNLWIYFPRK